LVVASSRRGSFLSAIPGFVVSGSESLRAFAAPDCFAVDRRSGPGSGELRIWLFTKHGFFSAVCARQRKPRPPLSTPCMMSGR